MDMTFDVLLKKEDIDRISIEEITAEWGGEVFSLDPRKYKFMTSIEFKECINTRSYEQLFKGKSDINLNEYTMLILEGNSLNLLEEEVNRVDDEMEVNELLLFISDLYENLNLFYIRKGIDDRIIERDYIVKQGNEAIALFKESLKWDSAKGILLSKTVK